MEGIKLTDEKYTGLVNSAKDSKIDPSQFDATIKQLLVGQGAEKYVHIFRQHNIGQSTLALLSETDLLKLGVDDANIRKNILSMVKDLTIFEELSDQKSSGSSQLSLKEISEMLTESTDHLNRIYMSLCSTTKALSKEGVTDTLLYQDKYASDVAINTLNEVASILDSMENVLQNKMMIRTKGKRLRKKMVVGAIGSAVIITLGVLLARSLKQLK